MKVFLKIFLLLAVTSLLACTREAQIDPLARSKVDGMNREAFLNRYRNPDLTIELSIKASSLVQDSLPQYIDGLLRATNNLAFAYYLKADYSQAHAMVSLIKKIGGKSKNSEIELTIARLLEARLLQRNCQIADSYGILHDIEQSKVLAKNRDNLLYNYAQTEFYITSLVLNFHYRGGREDDVMSLINEVETKRATLGVDYAQDLALDYALAYGLQSAGESLRALEYCDISFDLMDNNPLAYYPYHYANMLQMTALALKSIPGTEHPDSILDLYDQARLLFFECSDPYQMLGGTTSTARYALLVSDTATAHKVLREWLDMRGLWQPFSAPKAELSLFELLLRSRYKASPDDMRRWFEHYVELQNYIQQNEKEDFVLQQTLLNATRRSHWVSIAAMALVAVVALLLVVAILLLRNAKLLRNEKANLEETNRREIERSAGVETCLSVMRHDISPFIGYLKNDNLPNELRHEVLQQLLRTFDNIQNWTRLSTPQGMAFHASEFALQQVFDEVRQQVISPQPDVFLTIPETTLRLWGDKQLVVIMLRNLINNALQHTEKGSVELLAIQQSDMIQISVRDTGCGMSNEQTADLFHADRKLTDGKEHGFGLILCRYIVKRHDDNTRRGCKIWVESQLGQGTTIHCLLAAAQHQ